MKIFFSGIGGSGVSAIAGFLAEAGNDIAGSDRLFDRNPDNPLKKRLTARGITILPQDGTGIDQTCNLAVFSTAVEQTNPDFLRASSLGLTIMTRPEYLAELVRRHSSIAVAGTSGKSTTAGMLAFLMQRLGLSPNFIGGGRVKQFRTTENPGNYAKGNSGLLVIEACESDGSIVNYRPRHTIIANLDLDHHAVAETAGMFRQLALNTSGLVICGADDKNLEEAGIKHSVCFSINRPSSYRAEGIEYLPLSSAFTVNGQRFLLNMPGRHNIYNALACIALLSEMGVSPGDLSALLPEFEGIERRFDIHLNDGESLVIDDYAHNPHKIASLMQTMTNTGSSVCYIFQPHGFGPTRTMKDGYIRVFSENLRASDRLLLLPIYDAGGTADRDISSSSIANEVKAAGKDAEVTKRTELLSQASGFKTIVVLGARDDSLSDVAEEIANAMK